MIEIHTVAYEKEALKEKAQLLADQLHFNLDNETLPCLLVCEDKVGLKLPHFSLLYADFKAVTWVRRKAEGKSQPLIRACKPKPGLKIIDVTAGWGRDAAVLANFGAEVLLLERHPVMAALLKDALENRSLLDKQQLSLSLISADALYYLNSLKESEFPDVIYIDPMHPERHQSALVKKEMQALQQLIGEDLDALELIQCARKKAKQRVVVKWPQKLQALVPPDLSIHGKTIRFDLYF